jgi:cell division protein FtsW
MIKKPVDYKLFFAIFFLIIFWMIMISSVSVYSSFRVTEIMMKNWDITEAFNHFYVLRNIVHIIISFFILWIIVKIHYSFFEKYSKYFFWLSLILLVIVLVMWMTLKWARWWLNIPWVPFTIQPTEFLKISLIIYLAAFFKKFKWHLGDFKNWFIPFAMIIWIVLLLVWLQPDFWTIMVLIPISVIMFYYAWANIKHLLLIFILWSLFSVIIYSAWDYDKITWKNLNTLWYITQRIDNFLADNKEAIKNKTINYQTEQALIAIWSWWFNWLWFWQSIQKFWYLPEVQWDFIFSVIIEELWFIWWLFIIFIYLYIWYRWFLIASKTKELFWQLVAVWISSWIIIQAFINIWVNLNIVPLTWITLPFISYWGSSILSLMIWLWILLNISRYTDEKNTYARLNRKKIMF